MRLVRTRLLNEGMVLGRTIYNENGIILIQQGMTLTKAMIRRLVKQGITYVYIKDELTDDILVESVISEQLRMNAIETIKDTFLTLEKDNFSKNSYILDKKSGELIAVVKELMNELSNQKESISLLADILITDDYTFQHSINVTIYSILIGIKLNLTSQQLIDLGTGAILHDIGKVFIEKDILTKPGALTDEEYEIIKRHPKLGFDYIRKNTSLSSVIAHCAYQHHERLDGSGYPRGLKNSDIHLFAKVIAIADVFDAVTSNRVYRDALLPHEAMEILYAGAVDKFDKEMIEAFKKSVTMFPNGLSVELNDGRVGIVAKQNKHLNERPVVRVFKENNKELATPYEIDLAVKLNLMITSCLVD